MFDAGSAGAESAYWGEHYISAWAKKFQRGSEAFWIWTAQGKGKHFLDSRLPLLSLIFFGNWHGTVGLLQMCIHGELIRPCIYTICFQRVLERRFHLDRIYFLVEGMLTIDGDRNHTWRARDANLNARVAEDVREASRSKGTAGPVTWVQAVVVWHMRHLSGRTTTREDIAAALA